MCSKRWAKPVRPGRSFFEPTWYQRLTATRGRLRSRGKTTRRAVPRVCWETRRAGLAKGMADDDAKIAPGHRKRVLPQCMEGGRQVSIEGAQVGPVRTNRVEHRQTRTASGLFSSVSVPC